MNITDPNEPYFKDGIWGWDGAVWRRLSQLWGYSNKWAQVQRYVMPADADYSLTSTAVPAGSVYKLEFATIHNHGGARGMARISLREGGQEYYLAWTGSPARYEPTIWNGALTLEEGDQIRIEQSTCLAGDTIYAAMWGYEMLIAE